MSAVDAPGPFAPWGAPRSTQPVANRCPVCGETNSESARFCQQCAEPLSEPPPGVPVGRVVGIASAVACEVFGDERIERAWEELEQAGGVLHERSESPNLVVAVFGPEPPGGTGALGAVRAAAAVARELSAGAGDVVGDEPAPARIGVGSYDVMEGDVEERIVERVIGLAMRLQRMAAPGEVILAEDLHRLVGIAVSVEPVDPRAALDGGGTTGPLRLLGIAPPADGPALSAVPLIGRDRERTELRQILDRAVADRIGRLVGIVGEAGIGKTALVEESLRTLEATGEARVLRVRCRPAQEVGATWPLAEIVEQAAGIREGDRAAEARRKLEALFEDEPDRSEVEWMAGVIALPGANASAQETARALPRVLAQVARSEPLVVWVDDADRVEPSFWHMIRGAAASIPEVPLVVLCAAREFPPAVEGSGDLDIAYLEPLEEEDLASLAVALLGGSELDEGVRQLVVDTSGGNPFVAEHLVAMLVEEELVRWEGGRYVPTLDLSAPPTPPGAEAVLRARLDWVSPPEQIVAGLSAIVGEVFPVDLVAELLPQQDRPALTQHLEALAGKGLIVREAAEGGREWFAFRHALVREAAAKYVRDEARAEVHEHCATWLERAAGDRAPRSAEAIASHLVKALELQTGLGHAEPPTQELGERAAAMLEGAAARAGRLGDGQGAFLLLHRASTLLSPSDPRRSDLLLRSAIALAPGGDPRVAGLLADAASSARSVGARAVEWRARVLSAGLALRAGYGLDTLERAHATVAGAIEAFDEVGDETGLSWAYSLRAGVYLRWGNLARCARSAERAAEHARNAGLVDEEMQALRDLAWATLNGPLPVADAIIRCESIRARVGDVQPARQDVDGVLAVLHARAGHPDDARRLASGALSSLGELGLEEEIALCRYRGGVVDALAGRSDDAERSFREVLRLEPGSGRDRIRAQAAASLAHVVVGRGGADEALELAALSERQAAPEDVPTQVGWRTARAKALAQLGRSAEAESCARIAVRLAEQTDASSTRGDALVALAQVRGLAGRGNEAVSLAGRALRGFDRRGAEAQRAAARDVLERYGTGGSAAERAVPAAEAAPIPEAPVELPEAPAEPSSGMWLTPS